MALLDNVFYYNFGNGSSTGYYAVTQWSNHTATVGELIRQLAAPSVGNERIFVCIIGGATGASEPSWTLTRGAKTVSSSATYQECTGIAALNGDLTNTPNWTAYKAATSAGTLGQVIKDGAGTHIFIMTTAGTIGGSEPSWNTSAIGNTTTDNGATWTYLGTSFSNWAAPHARLQAAIATNWLAAGNKLFVGDNSAETVTSPAQYTLPGTNANPNQLLCVNHSGSVPPASADLTTGASLSLVTSGAIVLAGSFLMRGMSLQTATGATALHLELCASGANQKYKNCLMNLRGTSGGNLYVAWSAGGFTDFSNTTVQAASSASAITFNADGYFRWRNTASAVSGTFASPLITSTNTIRWMSLFEGVDLSAVSGTLFSGASTSQIAAILKDCKLHASVTLLGSQTAPAQFVDALRCANGANNYRNYRARYEGTQDTETTITRTGGATDGTQAQSWKIITSANCSPVIPFECQPIRIWNDITGSSRTVTLYGIWSGGAVPNNNDVWFDLQYYNSSSDPDAAVATCGLADELATAAGQSSDSSTWGGSTTAFKMSIIFTPQQKGYICLYPKVGKASTTVYIDPAPTLV